MALGETLWPRPKYSTVSALFSTRPRTWSNFVVNRLRAVRIPPFGPRLYLFRLCYETGEEEEKQRWSSLSHHFMVVYRIPYVDIRLERGCGHSGIEI